MIAYAAQRLVFVVFILVAMSLLVFAAIYALPGNTAAIMLGQFATPDSLAAMEAKMGLNDNFFVQYWRWASAFATGDLGQSMVMERPVAPILWDAMAKSTILAAASLFFVAVIGIVLGVVAAVRRGRPIDGAIAIFTYLGISVPEFFWGIVLILVFASWFDLLPTMGYASLSDGIGPFLAHLVLPVVTLTLTLIAHVSRMTRSSMLEVLQSNYVRAARARGLPERRVLRHHALRNGLLPSITVLAQDFGWLIGSIVVIETVFAYPGVGRLLIFAIQRQDIPVVLAVILVITAVYALANLAADLMYAYLNPRIRYGRSVG
ncbi:ABC transporter permease [Acuticoccus mangrovi]|uniref:ABC transporter permease n=1 Tax=Acuticoccus mangrovi TaxID=2796142 RepID=A0A934MGM8_9HYPH|nr:ABC transporter permease [Acuticoccus mangrovi]MBJ3776758.1 ABC transporter permease [Acuticoccus mangrovi]